MKKSPRNSEKVKAYLKSLIQPHMIGVDLGCGNGRRAAEFAQLCERMVGIDKKSKCRFSDKFVYRSEQIEDWMDHLTNDDVWDFFHSRLVIHFLNEVIAHQLLDQVAKHTKPGGFVYLLNFYDDPTDNHPVKISSYFTTEDIIRHFPGWQIVWADQYSHRGPGLFMDGEYTFFHTEFLAVKPV